MMWRAPVLLLILLAAARLAGPVPKVERAAGQDQDTRRHSPGEVIGAAGVM
jgi:hypothetical protein